MGVTIDTIGVDVVARINQLDGGLRQAEAKVDASARKMTQSINRVRITATSNGKFVGVPEGKGALDKLGISNGDIRFGKLFGALSVMDRLGVAMNAAIDQFQVTSLQLADGSRTFQQAATEFGHRVISAIPGFEQWAKVGERLTDSIMRGPTTWSLAAAQTDIYDPLHNRMAEAHIDAAGGGKTVEGIRLKFVHDMESLSTEIKKQVAALLASGTTWRDGNLTQFLNLLNGSYRTDRVKSITRDRDEALKALESRIVRGPAFDTFSTVLGSYKAKNMGGGDAGQSSKEDTQKKIEKHAASTAKATERTAKAVESLAGNVPFG